jgi:signal transduction histidine kinase
MARSAKDAAELSRFSAKEFQRSVEDAHRLLALLAQIPEVRGGQGSACDLRLRRILLDEPLFANVGVADVSGRVLCSAHALGPGFSLAGRIAFEGALRSRAFAAGDIETAPVPLRGLGCALPLLSGDGSPFGVVFATIDLESLSHRLGNLPVAGAATALTLVDGHGIVLARWPEPEKWIGKTIGNSQLGEHLVSGDLETTHAMGLDGDQRVYAFVPVPLGGGGRLRMSVGVRDSQVINVLEPAFGASMVGMATLLVVALAASWLGTSFLLVRRIEALQIFAQRLRAGDLHARSVLEPGEDELGRLSTVMDGLARELDEANRKRDELQSKLEEAVQVREEFLSIAAHELRTPLTSMRLQMELLGRDVSALPPDEQYGAMQNRVGILVRQTDRLNHLVSTLLELSRLSAGRLKLDMVELDLCEVVRGVSDRFGEEVERTSARLTLGLPETATTIGDRLRLEQVVTNLLSNALKYASGTPIEITIEEAPSNWRLAVRDHGRGIPGDKVDRIFDRFEQAGASDTKGGLGLGLYICRQIVQAHGGSIRASNAAGGGALLTVDLPRKATERLRLVTPPASTSAVG